ncbi:MAG: branched-chain amino acid ABC transporter permease, partial [Paracoccaceae bacterium]|nr:branched-chain amino acid ABC transporter permease [Paracoccaceae bacterium]
MIGQLVVNGIINASLIAPPAIAFSLLFGVLRFPNFAIGGYITAGAFVAYAINVQLGLPLYVATVGAMAAMAVLVWLSDVIVFRPMRGQTPVTLLVVSIALTLIIEQTIRLFYGANVRGFNLELQRPMRFWGVRITSEQVTIIVMAVAIALAVHLMLRYTRTGKAMRATADNPMLAGVRGIDTARVIGLTWCLCGALFGLTGVFAGLDLVIEPLVGWNLTIPIFAAAILGGIGSPYGA